MGYHVMEYMGRMVRRTCVAVLIGFVMLILMGQAQSRRNTPSVAAARDSGPWSAEFALTCGEASVGLGAQEGAFPWNTGLETRNVNFWRSAGEDFFAITASDGSHFGGTRRSGMADARDGLLLEIRTENPDWQTARGVCVGMSMEETLSLYPEASAEHDPHRTAGSYRYTYSGTESGRTSGFSRLTFTFEQNVLTAIDIRHIAA